MGFTRDCTLNMKNPNFDFMDIMYCRDVRKQYERDDSKIGMIADDCSEECLRSYKGRPIFYDESKYTDGCCTIEEPMCKKELDRQKENHSLLTTVGTMIAVPMKYIIPFKGL